MRDVGDHDEGRAIIVGSLGGVEEAALRGAEGSRLLTPDPRVYQRLLECDVPVSGLHEYFPFEELDRLSEALVDSVSAICRRGDEALDGAWIERPRGFRPFDAMHYYMKSVVDALAFRGQELRRMLASSDMAAVEVWVTRTSTDPADGELRWKGQATTLGCMARAMSNRTGALRWRDTSSAEPSDARTSRRSDGKRGALRRWMRERMNANRVAGIRRMGAPGFRRLPAGRARLLVIETNHDILDLLDHVVPSGRYAVDWWTAWDHDPFPTDRMQAWDVKWKDVPAPPGSEMMSRVVRQAVGSDLSEPEASILRLRIHAYLAHALPYMTKLYQRARAVGSTVRPSAVLVGAIVPPEDRIVVQGFHAEKITVLALQHGGHYGYVWSESRSPLELGPSDRFGTYGPEVTNYLDQMVADAGLETEVHTVGWKRQGRRLEGPVGKRTPKRTKPPSCPRDERSLVLYVPTAFVGDTRYGPHYLYDDVAYFRHQLELVGALGGQEEWALMVKLHYKEMFSSHPLARELEDEEIPVIQDEELSEVLPYVDVVVLDWPSTVLLEALAFRCPVIYVELGQLRWRSRALTLFEKAAIRIQRDQAWEGALIDAVRLSASENWKPDPDPFLEAFATPEYTPSRILTGLERGP